MSNRRSLLFIAVVAAAIPGCAPRVQPSLMERAMRIQREAPLIDGHNDLPWQLRGKGASDFARMDFRGPLPMLHTDVPRLKQGGVGGVFFAAYVPSEAAERGMAARMTLEQIDLIHRMVEHAPELELALTADDIVRIHRGGAGGGGAGGGRIAALIGIEGGHAIEDSLPLLRQYYALGARYMTLTHNQTINWADAATSATSAARSTAMSATSATPMAAPSTPATPATPATAMSATPGAAPTAPATSQPARSQRQSAQPRHGGLSPFGEEVVREMNRLGMMVDLSHVSDDTMRDALRVSEAPIIFSHSSARALAGDQPRDVPDDVLARVRDNGGVVMINFFSGYLLPEARPAPGRERANAVRERLREQFPGDEDARRAAWRQWTRDNPMPRGDIATVANHIDHVIRIAGIDHVGLGSDYDGVSTLPQGLEDVSCFPALTAELLRRGHGEAAVKKIIGGNLLRVMRECESTARRLQAKRPPSTARSEPDSLLRDDERTRN